MFNTVAGDCASQENSINERNNRTDLNIPEYTTRKLTRHKISKLNNNFNRKLDSNSILFNSEDIERSSLWKHTKEFHFCHKNLKSRFEKFMETGDLVSIDGELFPSIVET